MSHISGFFLKIKRENREFAGNLVPSRILGTRTQYVAMEGMIVDCQWKMLHFVVKILRKMDFSIVATFGNVSFLVLCHFWTNLSAGVTASRWNVDHVKIICCVRPCHNVAWLLQWCIQVSFNNCLVTFVALFRKKIFGEIYYPDTFIRLYVLNCCMHDELSLSGYMEILPFIYL